jgi:hypothetical protein
VDPVTDHRDAELTERLLTEAERQRSQSIPAQRPGVEFHRATWVLVILSVVCGLVLAGWVFWWVFVGSKQ